MDDDRNKANLTTAQTDSETGNEGLSAKEQHQKHLQAIKILFEKGLISEEEYKHQTSKHD